MSNPTREIIKITDDLNDPTKFDAMLERMPNTVLEAIKKIPEELLNCPPEDLKPTEMDKVLRVSFWAEYENSEKQKRAFLIVNVLENICTKTNFYLAIVKRPERLAYIIRPFVSYNIQLNKLHDLGLKRLEEILMKKDADSKMAAVQVKALEFVNVRLHGSPVQNIKKLQVHIDGNKPMATLSPEELQKQLEEMKQKSIEGMMKNVGPAPEED